MSFRIAIAGTYPAGTYEAFAAQLAGTGALLIEARTQREFDALEDADIVLLRILKMPERDMARLPSLKAILRWGVGYDTVDLAAAGKRGIYVCNTPGANAHAVAELTVMMMLALGRRVLCYRDDIARGLWVKNTYLNQTVTLRGKLVGIVGGGNIGRRVACGVQAFGARVQYYDRMRLPPEEEARLEMAYVPLEALLRTSDIVTLHVPLTDATRHMIGGEQLQSMKDGAVLINCARGGLVDDEALLRAVQTGKLAGAGIDTPEVEPPAADSGLRTEPRILLLPHIGGDVSDVGEVAVPMIAENMKRLIRGETPRYIVNAAYLQHADCANA